MNQPFNKDAELLIDGLRGIAALMVMFTHAFELVMSEQFGWNHSETPDLWRFARASLGNGDFWVWCFFVISGLCIHRSIARELAEGRFAWGRYVMARATRLYPLFLVGLMLAILAWCLGLEFGELDVSPPWPQLVASLFNLQLFTTAFPSFGPSWSLTCEVIYYAAWPMALIMTRGRVSRAATYGLVISALIMAGIFFLWHGLHRLEHSTAVNGLWTVCVLAPAWLAGAWLGGVWGSMNVSRRVWLLGIVSSFLVMILEWLLRYKHYPSWGRHFTSWGAIPGLVLLIAGAGHLRLSMRTSAGAVCRWLGQFSYPCYILHVPLFVLVNYAGDLLLPGLAKSRPALLTSLEILLVLAVLVFVGPFLERYFMDWRSRLLKSRRV